MNPNVRALPTLAPASLLQRRVGALPAPLDRAGTTFWHSGRIALYQAAKLLKMPPGSGVALPAFCCGSEIEPFIHAGLKPRFYAVTEALDPEPESFQAAIDQARIAVVTHFLGFAANLEKSRLYCSQAGVVLLEDCAHALYSDDERGALGAAAEMAIFSMLKTLPLADGGALVHNLATSERALTQQPAPRSLINKRTASLISRHLQAADNRWVAAASQLPSRLKAMLGPRQTGAMEPASQDSLARVAGFQQAFADTAMSRQSMRTICQADHRAIRRARRHNFSQLLARLDGISGIRPLFSRLPAHTCPLAMPIVAAQPADFEAKLAQQPGLGIKKMWPWFHPSVDWSDYPLAARLKAAVYILPVHQSLTDHETQVLHRAIDRWRTHSI